MFPVGPITGDGSAGLSYSGVYVGADRDQLITLLGDLRFTGFVGPQEDRWVLAVAGNPLGKVAAKKRRIEDVARDVAAALETVTLAVEVDKDERLRLQAFDGVDVLPAYDSRPPDDDGGFAGQITLDDFGNPVMSEGAFVDTDAVAQGLLATFEAPDPEDALAELLEEELSEDTSESERLTAVLRLLGLPTWIVSSDSLPKRVPGGPEREQVTRLGAGKPGVSGRLAEALTKPARPRPKRDL